MISQLWKTLEQEVDRDHRQLANEKLFPQKNPKL